MDNTHKLQILQEKVNTTWAKILSSSSLINKIKAGEYDKRLYAIYMAETYHYTYHNSRNQALVGVSMKVRNTKYMQFCFEHALEETGHELMALHDIKSIGYNLAEEDLPEALPETEALIGYLYWISANGNPLRRLGYSFWAENAYGFIGEVLAKIQTDLGLNVAQMTFFTSHAHIDEAHAEEVKQMLLQHAQTEEDWLAIEKVAEHSLKLTWNMMDAIEREYNDLVFNQAPKYAIFNGS